MIILNYHDDKVYEYTIREKQNIVINGVEFCIIENCSLKKGQVFGGGTVANINVEGSKQLISQNNENSISLLKGLGDSLNYVKVGNTIDPKAIEFIVSSVDSNVANDKTNKEVVEEKSNYTIIYVIGSVLLVCATGGLVYVIYNQNKSLKGGD